MPLDQFHGEKVDAVGFFHRVQRYNIRMLSAATARASRWNRAGLPVNRPEWIGIRNQIAQGALASHNRTSYAFGDQRVPFRCWQDCGFLQPLSPS
jgi:hypothetical protein